MSETTLNATPLIRTKIWSDQLKEILRDELMAMTYVDWMANFPDGNNFTIPSIGDSQVRDYTEDTEIEFTPLDKGEFVFNITEYLSAGHYITDKAKQDLFYAQQLEASFVPKMERAMMERLEADILNLQAKQTAANPNTINGARHRYAASGTSGTMAVEDFAYANFALNKATVSANSRVAIVDPATAFHLETLTNLTNVSNNPMWEGVVSEGISTGMRFVKNVYGFDCYVSQRLAKVTETLADYAGNSATRTNFAANLLFSADGESRPFLGAWRQMPEVEYERNVKKKRDEYSVTARYGLDLYRPEGLITILSTQDAVVNT